MKKTYIYRILLIVLIFIIPPLLDIIFSDIVALFGFLRTGQVPGYPLDTYPQNGNIWNFLKRITTPTPFSRIANTLRFVSWAPAATIISTLVIYKNYAFSKGHNRIKDKIIKISYLFIIILLLIYLGVIFYIF